MASNSFGNIFRITTWGESHGRAIGVVIDGCPAGIPISEEEINHDLARRSPGNSPYTSPRKEKDLGEIMSGVFEGKTTGTPISIVIWNQDQDSSKYDSIKNLYRPGHASYTYLQKYGAFDYRGGGRASARETAGRVAAGAVARKFLSTLGVTVAAWLEKVGPHTAAVSTENLAEVEKKTYESPVYCPDESTAEKMMELIGKVQDEGDSIGGLVRAVAVNLPAGLGDPVYEKLSANLSKAMISIPGTKGIEFGTGFAVSQMTAYENNDIFVNKNGTVETETNHAGGILGGISTGMPLELAVAFKPPSSIMKPMKTLDVHGTDQTFRLQEGSRHDPCIAVRGVTVVEAMMAITIADALLMNRSSKV
jgi:chorismate synthase